MGVVAFISLGIQLYAGIYFQQASTFTAILLVIGLCILYISFGYNIWKKSYEAQKLNSATTEIFDMKKIELLSAKIIDDFEFSIKEDPVASIMKDGEEDIGNDQDSSNKKKAS